MTELDAQGEGHDDGLAPCVGIETVRVSGLPRDFAIEVEEVSGE